MRREVQAMGLVGFAHFLSHFYTLSLPPLFVMIKPELGVSYTELGLVVAVSAVGVGILQTPCGFLVDRVGARLVLSAGLALLALSVILAGFITSYWALLAVWTLGGIGNSVFHPADYALLNSSVNEKRLGRAFSIHAFGGSSGLAVAPFVMLTLAAVYNWRTSLIIAGSVGLVLAGVIAVLGGLLQDTSTAQEQKPKDENGPSGIRLLMSRRMILFFLFFMSTSAAGAGINSFAVVALVELYEVDLVAAGQALTLFLIMAASGVLTGGILADKGKAHDRIVLGGFGLAALGFWLVGVDGLPFWLGVAAFAFAGFMKGVINPSRDVMVRNSSPPGEVGKVFAFVTTGFTISGGLIPPLFGWLMDVGAAGWIFWTSAIFSAFGIFVMFLASRPERRT